jgi:hypothetical protein
MNLSMKSYILIKEYFYFYVVFYVHINSIGVYEPQPKMEEPYLELWRV